MEYVFITLCIIGVVVIYVANRKQAERLERYKQKTEIENWYKNRLFHIIVTSINESDDSEYLRAAEEQRKLRDIGNHEVKVFTCVFRDDLGNHDETWEEYQARLICFIKEKEAERHAEIRKIDPNYYRRWVLGKKMPESACLFLMVEGDHSFIAFCIIGLVLFGGWQFLLLLAPSTRRKPAPAPARMAKGTRGIQNKFVQRKYNDLPGGVKKSIAMDIAQEMFGDEYEINHAIKALNDLNPVISVGEDYTQFKTCATTKKQINHVMKEYHPYNFLK